MEKLKKKKSSDIENLNNTTNELHLINIYKRLHSPITKHVFSVEHGAQSSKNYIVTTMKVTMDFKRFKHKNIIFITTQS